jgi:hypothetical protein
VHAYLGYDPLEFPPPTRPRSGDAADAMLDHMLAYGTRRKFTERELAEAIRLDPSQIRGFGPSLEAIIAMLEERRRRILERFETMHAQSLAQSAYEEANKRVEVPDALAPRLRPALDLGQLVNAEADRQPQDHCRRSLKVNVTVNEFARQPAPGRHWHHEQRVVGTAHGIGRLHTLS